MHHFHISFYGFFPESNCYSWQLFIIETGKEMVNMKYK